MSEGCPIIKNARGNSVLLSDFQHQDDLVTAEMEYRQTDVGLEIYAVGKSGQKILMELWPAPSEDEYEVM